MALSKVQLSESVGRRNLITNGAMQVAQRGTTVSALTGAGYKEGPDRFRRSTNQAGGLAVTRERLSNDAPVGFAHSLKETVTTVSDEASTSWAWRPVNYRIEGQDLQHLKFGTSNAESVTLSFYVKSNKTGTASVVIYSYDSGGNSRTNTRRFTINTANTWERKSLTFNGDTTTAIRNTTDMGFDILIYAQSGSARTVNDNTSWGVGETNSAWYQCNLDVNNVNDFIMFTGLQLEVGDTSTDFEHRSFAEELQSCQRYYAKSRNHDKYNGDSDRGGEVSFRGDKPGTSSMFMWYAFPVEMNHAPDITTEVKSGSNGPNDISSTLIGTKGFRAGYTGDGTHYSFYYYADAEL